MTKTVIDQAARITAITTDRSFIVEAPAGSGKTELLIQRFLALLPCVTQPEAILAITFTKKAANEMKQRILTAIKNFSDEKLASDLHPTTQQLVAQVLQHDQHHEWNLLHHPERLKIMTIDAFCAQLCQQMPIHADIGWQLNVSETPQLLYEQAIYEFWQMVMQDLQLSIVGKKLLLHLDNRYDTLETLFIQLLSNREQWLPYLMNLREQRNEFIEMLEANFLELSKIRITHARPYFSQADLDALTRILNFVHGDATPRDQQALTYWQYLANLLLTNNNEFRKTVNKNHGFPPIDDAKIHKEELLNIIKRHSNNSKLQTVLSEIKRLPNTKLSAPQIPFIDALADLLPYLIAHLKIIFNQQQQIDFNELNLGALRALSEGEDGEDATTLAQSIDHQLQHLLIDEFQDTSVTQFKLLELLTQSWIPQDRKTLFVVGDPMQSIYRFRNAEVSLFQRVQQQGLGMIKPECLYLQQNFRSNSSLISWVNQTFKHLFPESTHHDHGAVNYREAHAHLPNSRNFNIEYHADTSTGIAFKTIAAIQRIQQHHPEDTIAILVRSRTHLTNLLPALQAANLCYSAIDIDHLESGVQDLMTLARATLHLYDRIAWLALLRAPWCGLSLLDLHSIANFSPEKSLWSTINDDLCLTLLSDDAQLRLRYLRQVLATAFAYQGRTHFSHWLHALWLNLNGTACLHSKKQQEQYEQFFSMLANISEPMTLKKIELGIARLFADNDDSPAQIHIMTIHKAKGLEFDHVFLFGLERSARNDTLPLFNWSEFVDQQGNCRLLFAAKPHIAQPNDAHYDYLWHIERQKQYYENLRLLYVAATRARHSLQLCCGIDNYQENFTPKSGSFLALLWPYYVQQFKLAMTDNSTLHEPQTTAQKKLYRLPLKYFTDCDTKQRE